MDGRVKPGHDSSLHSRQCPREQAANFVQQCGDWLDSPLVTIDPVARHAYEHMDYKPLVNSRVGPGRSRPRGVDTANVVLIRVRVLIRSG